MQTIIVTALEAYRSERFLKAVNTGYASLRDDAAAWARVAEERGFLNGPRAPILPPSAAWYSVHGAGDSREGA